MSARRGVFVLLLLLVLLGAAAVFAALTLRHPLIPFPVHRCPAFRLRTQEGSPESPRAGSSSLTACCGRCPSA
jgi:hypothetical protein